MSLLSTRIPLANGGFIELIDDPSGFLILNVLKSDASVDSQTPMSVSQSQGILQQIAGIRSARLGMQTAGVP